MESTFLRPLPFFLYGHSRRVALTVQQRAAHSFFVQGGKSRAATGVFILFTVRLAKVEHTTAQPPLSPPAKLHLFYQHIQTIQKRHLINSKLFRVTWLCVCVNNLPLFVCQWFLVCSSVFHCLPTTRFCCSPFHLQEKKQNTNGSSGGISLKSSSSKCQKEKKERNVCVCVLVCVVPVCVLMPCRVSAWGGAFQILKIESSSFSYIHFFYLKKKSPSSSSLFCVAVGVSFIHVVDTQVATC